MGWWQQDLGAGLVFTVGSVLYFYIAYAAGLARSPTPKTASLTVELPVDDVMQRSHDVLDAIGRSAGWEAGEIRTRMFRHTYAATRLQTLDRGAPVSPWVVSREMGHGGRSLVDRVYGHLGDVRHRSEAVEFRVEQHMEALGTRLAALRP